MSPTRSIRTSTTQTVCDVCGRTLLRGERAEVYLAGSTRHSVCELCTSRALHGGWVREGAEPELDGDGERGDRRRTRLSRRFGRRRSEEAGESAPAEDEFFDASPEPERPASAELPASAPEWPELPERTTRRGRRRRPTAAPRTRPRPAREPAEGGSGREPRHVHAVPTAGAHKVQAAIELFNGSEHPRTVAGITRSLGLPDVAVHPASPVAALVTLTVSWELCWYRYEVDLSESDPTVRPAGQGYELDELGPAEREANVTAGEDGRLAVPAGTL